MVPFTRPDQVHRLDDHALLLQRRRYRHGTGGVRADIGVMGTVDHETHQGFTGEHGSDQRDIRQMGAAQVGIVENDLIPCLPAEAIDDIPHGIGHAAQMHRNMGRLGTEFSPGIEYGAGIVQAVTDIGRKSRIAQHRPHFVTNRFEAAGKQPQGNGIEAFFTFIFIFHGGHYCILSRFRITLAQ